MLEGKEQGQVKTPETMDYIEGLQKELASIEVVGKTTSIADVVKKIGFVKNGHFTMRLHLVWEVGDVVGFDCWSFGFESVCEMFFV